MNFSPMLQIPINLELEGDSDRSIELEGESCIHLKDGIGGLFDNLTFRIGSTFGVSCNIRTYNHEIRMDCCCD